MATAPIIPFFGLKQQYDNLRDELLDASDRVYTSGRVLDGEYTRRFESTIAARCDRKFGVAVNSCTQGLIMAMQCYLPPESKVLVPTLSFPATVNAVIAAGSYPEFCDTDGNGLMDIQSIDYALSGNINAIMYANLWGHVLDYDKMRVVTDFFNTDLPVIEDAAQSFGAYYRGRPSGSLGDVSVLSFDPTKNLPNYGSGGMILTDSASFYEDILDLRDNGKHSGHSGWGTNSKMSESDCAQMLVKLQYFDQWQRRRTEIAEYYAERLSDYVDVVWPEREVESAWHKFVILLSNRHALQHHLTLKGIETRIHYPQILPELVVSQMHTNLAREPYRESYAFTRECLSLPIYPELTDSDVEYVVDSILEFLR